jgi:acyl-lipid omega-6 desaturase (Delta-12 desaturase)
VLREYLARSRWGRLRYRIYRQPVIMFGISPAYLFFVQHRLPVGLMRSGWQPWLGIMATKASRLVLAASIGVRLFYIQH